MNYANCPCFQQLWLKWHQLAYIAVDKRCLKQPVNENLNLCNIAFLRIRGSRTVFENLEVVFSSPQFIVTTAMSKSAWLLQLCFAVVSCAWYCLMSLFFCINCFIFSNLCDALSTQINAVNVENSLMNPAVLSEFLCSLL